MIKLNNVIIEKMKEQDTEEVAKILIDSWKIAYKDIIDKIFLQNLSLVGYGYEIE